MVASIHANQSYFAHSSPILHPFYILCCFVAYSLVSQFTLFLGKIILAQTLFVKKKSRIRETKHLSTDADSSTDAIGGWTKANSAKKNFFFARQF